MYVCMLLSDRVIRDHACVGMISYASEWHEEVPIFMRNQVRRVVLIDI